MKQIRRIFATTILLSLMLLFSVPTSAAEYRNYTLGTKITVPMKGKVYYRVIAPDTGYIYLDTLGNSIACAVYDSRKKNTLTGWATEKMRVGVQKGSTYFFYMRDMGWGNTQAQRSFCMTFQKYSISQNYCAAKAKTLKEGQSTHVLITQRYSFPHWYKFELDAKRKIRLYSLKDANGYAIFNVYDSAMRSIPVDSKATASEKWYRVETTKEVPAGTYYIKLNDYQLGMYHIYFR